MEMVKQIALCVPIVAEQSNNSDWGKYITVQNKVRLKNSEYIPNSVTGFIAP
jgi:hypothetical protein